MNVLELVFAGGEDKAKIRGMKGEDGEERWSVYDMVNAACEKTPKDEYGRYTFNRIMEDGSQYADEVRALCSNLKFPGRGQRDTPCMTLRGLQRLLMILGGKVAAGYRAVAETTFSRVMGGDRSLIQVIEANAQSTSPVQRVFKQSLTKEPAAKTLDQMCGVKRDRWDDLKFLKESAETYSQISADTHMDERARVFFKDKLMNQLMLDGAGGAASVTNAGSSNPLTISNVASKMGMVLSPDKLQEVGFAVAKAYKQKYGEKPTKHEQLCGGAVRSVNSYTERDRPMVEAVLATFK